MHEGKYKLKMREAEIGKNAVSSAAMAYEEQALMSGVSNSAGTKLVCLHLKE